MNLDYVLLTSRHDKDICHLLSLYHLPEISRYISIDQSSYFAYVTESPNVYFYKVYLNGALAAATHMECFDKTLYMDIAVAPSYQRKGLGTRIVRDIQSGVFPVHFERIEVSIDESNIASKKLFERVGFVMASKEDELENYVYVKR